ncbi:hypothetical protein DW322_21270 [Rhodococcus rhodnii]|uniref:Minor tail protein n=2 Tax=Rhodococcus rhodnii TaxID=38312 RepID=A0A6P2CKB0_9NOCA|nr:hypothetical protein [Rhodococcus rhodnii]TXG92231.1 hypothetical protein DW322_21270 [Rhodococcus rhodnii]
MTAIIVSGPANAPITLDPDEHRFVLGAEAAAGALLIPLAGRDGKGITVRGIVDQHTDLPADGQDVGDVYIVRSDGLGYVWTVHGWPPAGRGFVVQGPPGDPGRGYTDAAIAGNALVFAASDGTSDTVVVPALVAAAEQAAAAHESNTSAADHAEAAQVAAGAAEQSAADARESIGQPSDNSVTTAKIRDRAVTADKIGDQAVEARHLAPRAIPQDRLASTGPFSDWVNTKADLVGGKVPTGQLPAVALTKPFRVSNRAAMLALDVQEGDVAVVTGGSDKGTYMLGEGSPTVFESWVRLNAPDDAVSSVNGQTGTVVLSKSDVGLGSVNNTSDAAKPISTATQTALNGKVSGAYTLVVQAGAPSGAPANRITIRTA